MAALRNLEREPTGIPLVDRLLRLKNVCAVVDCQHKAMRYSELCALHRYMPFIDERRP